MPGKGVADLQEVPENLRAALEALTVDPKTKPKSNYAFWSTQPVSQFDEDASSSEVSPPRRRGGGPGVARQEAGPPSVLVLP